MDNEWRDHPEEDEVVDTSDLGAAEKVEVYGVAYPAAGLPLGRSTGIWVSEPLLDFNGAPDDAMVRVWFYGPEGPGKENDDD